MGGFPVPLPDVDVERWPVAELPALVAALGALTTRAAARLAAAEAARPAPDDENRLDARGVARELGVRLKQAYRLIAARVFPVEYVGRYPRVRKGDLRAWRDACRAPARGPVYEGLISQYTSPHDQHRIAAPQAPAGPDPARARGRRRRAHDDPVAVGDRVEPDQPARRDRPHAVCRSRGGREPFDLGAGVAETFLASRPAPAEG